MSVLSLLSHKPKPLYALVFDIASGSVRVSFVHYKHNKPVEVIFVLKELMHYAENAKADDLAYDISETIKKIGNKAIEKIGTLDTISSAYYEVHAIVHAPWSDSQSSRVGKSLKKETTITKEMIKDFVAKNFITKITDDRIQYDCNITSIALNGYATKNPYKKKAIKLSVVALSSTMSKIIYKSIFDTFSKIFPEHTMKLHPFLYVALHIQGLFHHAESFTFIDIGESYTSIHTIEDKSVINTGFARFGTEYLVSAVAQGDSESRATSVSEITLFLNNTCTPSKCHEIETLLKPAQQSWIQTFGDACSSIAQQHKLPTRVFLSVQKPYEKWFNEEIERFDFGQFTITNKPFYSESIILKHIKDKISFTNINEYDLSLALGVLHIHT